MKRLSTLLMIVSLFTISVEHANAQLNVKGIKNKAKSSLSVEESTKQEPAQQNDATAVKADDPAPQQENRIIYVSKSGSNKNDGSKESPMKNIDKAIEAAAPGDEIRIAEGIYMGTFNIGYLESDKPVKLYGSWDAQFAKQDIVNHPTVFQPDNESGGKSRKALLKFTKEVAGTIVDGIVWDMGERNLYHEKEGIVDGVEGGRIKSSTEASPGQNSTVEEPAISL
ncbi:MAG: DUF1565 domain-containing protein, partial [Anaerolineales bacterium]|nr:DUF1565 domain-containing protein [Anaerolineales bacterium]